MTEPSPESTAPPTAENIHAYIGGTLQVTLSQVVDALAAETAAQAKVCRALREDEDPADLDAALRRRVHRHLAMRNVPLGVQANDAGGIPLSSYDPEVRRLERPYRKLVAG